VSGAGSQVSERLSSRADSFSSKSKGQLHVLVARGISTLTPDT